jgi:hypothetical protein
MKKSGEILSAIKLEDAFFCLNCEAVTNAVDVCPVCGDQQLWPLQNWMGRVGDRENSRYGMPAREELQAVTQKIGTNGKEGGIVRGLSMFRKKILYLGINGRV